ncbi:hypothetical protein RHGRI_030076 [Rhododendron griersonianum]|uniref:Serine hydrolase domain-containing protein n=1 Tax=Rhododendron griersonianum TaxID=479676 RepID=A0AAV6ILH5_9ERIC|nr:hypothetical protein RHGRI_030076 [Rhododendron griersonianum]
MEQQPVRKPRVLCLHAFRTSGKIFEKQTEVWPEFVREKMDLVFIDAPFPAEGGSGVQGKFDPPYYEWFQFNQANSATAGDEGFDLVFTVHLSPIAATIRSVMSSGSFANNLAVSAMHVLPPLVTTDRLPLLVEVPASCRRRLILVRFSAGEIGFLTMAN